MTTEDTSETVQDVDVIQDEQQDEIVSANEPVTNDDQGDDNQEDTTEGEGEEPAPALVSITLDSGAEYEVTEEVAASIMKNKDYTQKTQTLAEKEKEFAASQERFEAEKVREEEDFKLQAQALSLSEQLKQYEGVDWVEEQRIDPDQAQQHFMRYQQIKDQHEGIKNQQKERADERTQAASQALVKRAEQTEEWAAKNLSGWSPKMAHDLYNYATQVEGYTDEAFKKELSPQFLNLLSKAHVGHLAITKTKQPKPAKKVEPTKTVSSKSVGTNRKDIASMSMDEYAAYMNKKERERAVRASR